MSTTPAVSYSRVVALHEEDGSGTLGTTRPDQIITDTDNRALLRKLGRWQACADITLLAHCTYGEQQQPATLMGISFGFSYPPASRLSSAQLNLTFEADEGDRASFPVIMDFAPRKIHTNITEASVSQTRSFTPSLELPGAAAPVGLSLSAEVGTSTSYKRAYRCEVVGQPYTSDGAHGTKVKGRRLRITNAVSWTVTEHPLQKDGIPRALRAVVVVGRKGSSMRATLTARVKTGHAEPRSLFGSMWLFNSLWPRDEPLFLEDGVEIGDCGDLSRDFKALSRAQLAVLSGLVEEGEDT